ncbi:hypothetical protein CRI93_14875 [Longimonas halophila]|uniref:Uncharacterized protein n=1 Tax=Longimonas halophila TaxID=1469170 RepID=A0A2H3P1I0_9BACT|nr:hypothetical protein [Longimonas halophila]PEN04622.1 hypothetical protein CRI93_14875 [Longimonas halophila]
MQITGTTTPTTTPRPALSQSEPISYEDQQIYDFNATPGQLKTLVENGSVKPRDKIYVVVEWNEEHPDPEVDENGRVIEQPPSTGVIPNPIKENVMDRLSQRLPLTIWDRSTHWAFHATAQNAVRELADKDPASEIDQIREIRIGGIGSAQPPPPPEDVPDANANAALVGPTKTLMIGGAGAVAWLLWKKMSLS